MDFLNRIAAKLTAFAAEALEIIKEDGIELAGKVVADVEEEFEKLVDQLGSVATKFVADLFSDDTLKGIEKANLAATQLAEYATTNGISIAEHDVTALIKNAYLAVKGELAKL